jgi:uncharacterized protein YggE
MKMIFPIKTILFLCLISLCTSTPLCRAITEIPRIRVFGESSLIVMPDHAVILIRIENKTHSARVVDELHKKIRGNVQQVLNDFKIGNRNIKISGPYTGSKGETISGINVIVRDLSRISDLTQAVSAKPGTAVVKIEYGHTRQSAFVESVRTMALKDAKKKALSMTRVLGTALDNAIFIQEIASSVSKIQTDHGLPEICITKKIEVVFQLGTGGGYDSRNANKKD